MGHLLPSFLLISMLELSCPSPCYGIIYQILATVNGRYDLDDINRCSHYGDVGLPLISIIFTFGSRGLCLLIFNLFYLHRLFHFLVKPPFFLFQRLLLIRRRPSRLCTSCIAAFLQFIQLLWF